MVPVTYGKCWPSCFETHFAIHFYLGLLGFFCFAGAYVLFDSLANWAYLEPITCTVRDAIGGAFAEPDPVQTIGVSGGAAYWLIPLAFFFVAVFPIGAAHWLDQRAVGSLPKAREWRPGSITMKR